jgi:phage terminase small subunit
MNLRSSVDLGGRITPPFGAKTGTQLRKQLMEARDFTATELVWVEVAAKAYDLARKAERLWRRQGLMIETPRGQRLHPAIAAQQVAEGRMLRAFKALGL